MFCINQEFLGRLSSYKLHSPESNIYLKCIPEFGANIIELQLEKNGNSIQILDGFKSEELLRSNDKSRGIHLAPFPNRIRDGKFIFEGKAYQLPINKPRENNAIHGFIWNCPFTIVEQRAEESFASITLEYQYAGDFPGYPFPFQLIYEYTISDVESSVAMTATNTGNSAMPFGIGWHPYFTFNTPVDNLELQLPDCSVLNVDERLIPTGDKKPYHYFRTLEKIKSTDFDTAFKLIDSDDSFITRLYDPAVKTAIILSHDQSFPYLQVYIPPDRNSIALEPMSCPANAFNTGEGLVVLNSGERFEGKILVSLTCPDTYK